MRKIRLSVEDLAVDSFRTDDGTEMKVGTVRAHGFTQLAGCVVSGMSDCATCDGGCPRDTMTCFASCRMTNGYQACIDPYC